MKFLIGLDSLSFLSNMEIKIPGYFFFVQISEWLKEKEGKNLAYLPSNLMLTLRFI